MREISGYYLTDFNPFDPERIESGIDRKIKSQIKALNGAGLNCRHIYAVRPNAAMVKGIASLPFFPDFTSWPNVADLGSPNYLYVRRPAFSTKGFIAFLSEFRRHNPSSIIMIEVPTFPYDKEFDTPQLFFALKKDRKYRICWKKYADYSVILSDEDEVFGLPSIHIMNGIDLDAVSVRTPSYNARCPIEILFPASFSAYHGCDLLILGLSQYYKAGGSREIVLHLAGEGPASATIHDLIYELHLENRIIEHGMLDKESLDRLYNRCSLAVGSLGMHRIGSVVSAALKTREYLAKGIPFFYSGLIDVFERRQVDFSLRLESTEEPVDVNKVIEFYDWLYSSANEETLIRKIRQFAEKYVSISSAMSNVTQAIVNHSNGL